MTLRSIADRALQIVQYTLRSDGDPDVRRFLVSDAIVARDGDHYRIEHGAESPEELDLAWKRATGRCDCGGPLSIRDSRAHCRECGREFLAP